MPIKDQIFEDLDAQTPFADSYYENCQFLRCNFAQTGIPKINFDRCLFDSCDLSMTKLQQTSFHETLFKNCKMLGFDFTLGNPFSSFEFENCKLSYANFFERKLCRTRFLKCDLSEADFSDADLQGALFESCQLDRAVFNHSNLCAADLSSSNGFTINPLNNRLKNAVFSRHSLDGLLCHWQIKIKE